MKKKIILTGMLTFALFAPVSEAQAQGWPNFDVAKLASLITNLVGRFQPVPQVLSRVNQVKSTIAQVQAVGQAAVSGDLKSIGIDAAKGLAQDAFKKGAASPVESAAKGSNGSSDASGKVKETMFSMNKGGKLSMDERQAIAKSRVEYQKSVAAEVLAKSFYIATNGPEQSAKRFEKADNAMKNAGTIHDSVNANTMMIMAGNYERLSQISLELVRIKQEMVDKMVAMPVAGYSKPQPVKDLKMGDAVFSEEEKDEIDVDF